MNSVERLAERLDAEGIAVDRLRADFAGWVIWYSHRSGHFHAHRTAGPGGFTEREHDPRRFHVAARTTGRLAVLLLAQTLLDAERPETNDTRGLQMELREDHAGAESVASWSAHRIPVGTPVRYVVGAVHDEAPIRLVLGSADQVELEMPVSAVEPVITALRNAVCDVKSQIAVQ